MKRTLLIPGLIFLLFAGKSFAQFPGMSAVNRQLNQQFITQQMNMNMSMMMRMHIAGYGSYNPKHTFSVLMKDSTLRKTSSKILYDTTQHKSYIEYTDKNIPKSDPNRKQKIYVDQTLQISRMDVNNLAVTGTAQDTCWMFKVLSGPVAAYSYMAESTTYFEPGNIIAIQNENGPIEPFKPNNLEKMIAKDPQAMKLFNKKEYYKALLKYNRNALKKYL